MTSTSEEKLRPFICFFQSREQVVVRRGQILRIGRVIKEMEAQVGQFLLGCKCPVSRGTVVQEQDPVGDSKKHTNFYVTKQDASKFKYTPDPFTQ